MARTARTSKRAIGAKARAASKHQTGGPAYRLSVNRRVKVRDLKADARRVQRRRGRSAVLRLRQLSGKGDYFNVMARREEGRKGIRLTLPTKGDKPARGVGGLAFPRDLREAPTLAPIIDDVGPDYREAARAALDDLARTLNRRKATRRLR